MSNPKYTHIVYLIPNINESALQLIHQHCGKDSSGKPLLYFFCSEVDDSHPFYLKITSIYSNGAIRKLRIPNSIVLLIYENSENQEVPALPFGFVPSQPDQA